MQTESALNRAHSINPDALSCLFRDLRVPFVPYLLPFHHSSFLSLSSTFTLSLFPRAERWQTFHNEVWPDLT